MRLVFSGSLTKAVRNTWAVNRVEYIKKKKISVVRVGRLWMFENMILSLEAANKIKPLD